MIDVDVAVCKLTGVRLVPDNGRTCFRIAKTAYPPLSAPDRSTTAGMSQWGRFDSYGRTLYLASTLQIAYAEVMSPFKRRIGDIDSLAADAEALGVTAHQLLEEVAEQWEVRRFMGVGAIPRKWRTDRAIHEISMTQPAWYVDVEHPETLAYLEEELWDTLRELGVRQLTTAHLRGEDRALTVAVSQCLRTTVVLPGTSKEDVLRGSQPCGIQYGSKFGGGWCRAVWLPENSDLMGKRLSRGLSHDLVVTASRPILESDKDLLAVARRFRLSIF